MSKIKIGKIALILILLGVLIVGGFIGSLIFASDVPDYIKSGVVTLVFTIPKNAQTNDIEICKSASNIFIVKSFQGETNCIASPSKYFSGEIDCVCKIG